MSEIRLLIEGKDAISATEALYQNPEFQGDWQSTTDETNPQKEVVTLATIATIVAIASETLSVAEKIYGWYKKYQKDKGLDTVVIVKNGKRFLLEDLTVEEIREVLNS